MIHLFAVLGVAAACGVWWLVQWLGERPVDGCCGLNAPAERGRDCADCPDRSGHGSGEEGASSGRVLLSLVLAIGIGQAGCSAVEKEVKGAARPTRHSGERLLMGTRFVIQVISEDGTRAEGAISAAFDEVARVEELLSEWKETSEISAVNREAGDRAVRVGPELLEVVRRAREIAELTDGAFDPTFAACGATWSMRDRRIPSEEESRACTALVNWRAIQVDEASSTLFLPQEGMRLGIAGIGKGHGVDRAAAVLESRGIHSYFVDGGGDVRLSGRRWVVGIAHPRRLGELLGRLELASGSIVTSGDYHDYFEQDGVRYHHLLDPRTGRPARGVAAVTVTGPDATTADALATGLFVLGPERGLQLVESLPGVEALFVLPDLEVRPSSGFPAVEPPA